MDIQKARSEEKIILAISGRLDTTTAAQLQEALIPSFDEAKQVEIDFTELAYVSSAGLRVLLSAQKTAKAKGAALVLKNVSEEVMEVFKMTGFSDILTIV